MSPDTRLRGSPGAWTVALVTLLVLGSSAESPRRLKQTTPPPPSSSSSTPFFGVNLDIGLAREAVNPGWQYEAALGSMRSLGITTVRVAVYCAGVLNNRTSPYPRCLAAGLDDIAVARTLAFRDGLSVTPVVIIDFARHGPDDGADRTWRRDHFTDLGVQLGRSLGTSAPYFELGNEPDNSCLTTGTGAQLRDYEPGCVERARIAISALQDGITAGARDISPDAAPRFAVGVSGPTHWGMTDLLWNGSTPNASTPSRDPIRWDYTVVHWYYPMSYGRGIGTAADQETGFDNYPGALSPVSRNPAAQFRDRYDRPILITEFGIPPVDSRGAPYEFAAPTHAGASFERILAGLLRNADEYRIEGVIAYTLVDGASNWSGGFGLMSLEPDTRTAQANPMFAAYQAFIAATR